MTRDLSSEALQEIEKERTVFTHLLEINFDGGTLHWTSFPDDLRTSGFTDPPGPPNLTWSGVGGVFGFGEIVETSDDQAQGSEVTLSGVDTSIIGAILNNQYRNRDVRIWRAYVDEDTGEVVAAIPLGTFKMNGEWKVTRSTSDRGGGTVDVTTRLASRLSELRARRGVLTNVVSHQEAILEAATADDRFFEFVGPNMGTQLFWGRERPEPAASSGGGGNRGGGTGEGGRGPGGETAFQ